MSAINDERWGFSYYKWFNTIFLLITIATLLTKISKEHADGTGNVQILSRCFSVQKKKRRGGEITFFPDLWVFAEHSPSIGEPVISETTHPFPPIHQSQKLGHMLHPCRLVGESWFSIASSNEQHFKGIIHVLIFKQQKKTKEFCPSSSSWQLSIDVNRSYSIVIHPLVKDSVEVDDTRMGKSHCKM